MASEKCLRQHEWSILEKYQHDHDRSISRIFDEIQAKRCEMNLPAIGRKWFIKEFAHGICNASNGKIGSRFHLPVDRDRYTFHEQILEPVATTRVEDPQQPLEEHKEEVVESYADYLVEEGDRIDVRPRIIFCLRWLKTHGATDTFRSFYEVGGYKKSIAELTAKRLYSLGLIEKANKKRYSEFDWDKIVKHFPEINSPEESDHPEWKKTVHESKKSQQEVTPVKTTETKKTQKKSDMEKAIDWLLHEDHAQNEFTKPELIVFLRSIRVPDAYSEADKAIYYWIQQNAISQVPGTYAYRILPMAKLLGITVPQQESDTKTPEVQEQKIVQIVPEKKEGKDIVIRCNGKDVRVINKSSSTLSITIENGSVILMIV